MTHAQRVARNSAWLIAQPLVLNLISLFVVGYIARVLGQDDYGRFTFAFAYVAIFMPLTGMGLGSLTTRAVAKDIEGSRTYVEKMLALRLLLAIVVFCIALLSIFWGGYTYELRILMLFASITIIFNALTSTLSSVFQGFERMEFVAYAQFVSGGILTALSVVVLYIGGGVFSLTLVYVLGSLLSALVSFWLLLRWCYIPVVTFDWKFIIEMLRKGFPFFIPAFLSLVGMRLGMIILQKISGDSAVGIYGAAYNLVDRLMIIPDGICTAIFPTIAALYAHSQIEALKLMQRFFRYLFLLGSSIAVGGTILAPRIMTLIYGDHFIDAGPVFIVLLWWLFLIYIGSLFGWTLGAIHKEKYNAMVPMIVTPITIIASLLLVSRYGAIGAASALVVSGIFQTTMLYIFIKKAMRSHLISPDTLIRIVFANIVMAAAIYVFSGVNIVFLMLIGAVVFILVCILTGLISIKEINNIFISLRK